MIDTEMIPVPRSSAAARRLGEEMIILSEEGDELHVLNELGTFLWQSFDGTRSLETILDLVSSEYDITREAAERDLLSFVEELRRKDLIEVRKA